MTSDPQKIRIALDAMGGDNAPECVVSGADIVRETHRHIDLVFFGDKSRIGPLLKRSRHLGNATIIHTDHAKITGLEYMPLERLDAKHYRW